MPPAGGMTLHPADVGYSRGPTSRDVIPDLIRDLTHAFDDLRLENERLRVRLGDSATPEGGDTGHPSMSDVDIVVVTSSVQTMPPPTPDSARMPMSLLSRKTGASRGDTDRGALSESRQLERGLQTRHTHTSTSDPGSTPPEQSTLLASPSGAHCQLLKAWDPSMGYVHLSPEASQSVALSSATGLPIPHHKSEIVRTGDMKKSDGPFQRFILSPHSRKMALWDFVSVTVLVCDIFISPLSAFGVYPSHYFMFITAGFWTLDICARFCVGYHDHTGVLEMRPRQITQRYLKTGFVFDVALVALDWLVVLRWSDDAAPNQNKLLRVNKGIRLVKLVRMMRLLRVVRMMKMFDSLEAVQRSLTLATAIKVFKKVLFIVIINHFIACAWYGISSFTVDNDFFGWSTSLPSDRYSSESPSTSYEYFTALHWALTQFTPASMEVTPKNPIERVFAIIVMIGAMLAFSSVVASMTATMTQFLRKHADYNRQKYLVKQFINEHRLSVDLSMRISSFMTREQGRKGKQPILERGVDAFKALPDGLKKEVHVEMYAPTLKKHPVMVALDSYDAAVLGSICHTAMLDEFFLVDEDIWSHGAVATKMYFVASGKLQCFPEATMSVNRGQSLANADSKAGDIMCEQALWLVWHLSGFMSTTTDVSMFTLSATKFGEIVRCSVGVQLVFIYARNFHEDALMGQTGITCNLTRAHDLVKRSLEELQPDVQRTPSMINTPSRLNRLIRSRTHT